MSVKLIYIFSCYFIENYFENKIFADIRKAIAPYYDFIYVDIYLIQILDHYNTKLRPVDTVFSELFLSFTLRKS